MTEQELSDRARNLRRTLFNRFPHTHFELETVDTSMGGEWSPSHYVVNVFINGHPEGSSYGGYRPERAFQNALLELTARSGEISERTEYDQEVVTTLMSALLREAGWQCNEAWREDGTPQNRYTIRLVHPEFQDVVAIGYGWELMNVLEDAEYHAQHRLVSGSGA